jgi:hypothetical protein
LLADTSRESGVREEPSRREMPPGPANTCGGGSGGGGRGGEAVVHRQGWESCRACQGPGVGMLQSCEGHLGGQQAQ